MGLLYKTAQEENSLQKIISPSLSGEEKTTLKQNLEKNDVFHGLSYIFKTGSGYPKNCFF